MFAAVALIGLVLADAGPLTSASASAPPVVPPSFFAAYRERFLAKVPAGSIAVFHAATALASSFLRKVAGLADVPAILVGTLVTRGGIKGIQIKSIEKQKT